MVIRDSGHRCGIPQIAAKIKYFVHVRLSVHVNCKDAPVLWSSLTQRQISFQLLKDSL